MPLHRIELPPQGPSSGTLVLLHGYGADEHDLIGLAAELDPSLRAVSLAAPQTLPWGGRAWYALEQRGGSFGWDAAEVQQAARLAIEAVAAVAAEDGRPPLLLGFSQGAGIALLVALQRPELVRGVLSLSGVPPDRADTATATASFLGTKGLPVFGAHGLGDPLLPIAVGRHTRALLEDAGCDVTWREYPMAHQIVGPELDDARHWLKALPAWQRAKG